MPGGRPDTTGGAHYRRDPAAGDRHVSDLAYPLHIDGRGRTAEAGYAAHVRDLIEQVVFTAPGERVNRPDFGSSILQLMFAPNSDSLEAATQAAVQAAL